MFKIIEGDFLICPYNFNHIIKRSRFQVHLIKCKRKYPEVELATCFYNYAHKVKREDLLQHYEVCPYKVRIEENRYHKSVIALENNHEIYHYPESLKLLRAYYAEFEGNESTHSKDVKEQLKNFYCHGTKFYPEIILKLHGDSENVNNENIEHIKTLEKSQLNDNKTSTAPFKTECGCSSLNKIHRSSLFESDDIDEEGFVTKKNLLSK